MVRVISKSKSPIDIHSDEFKTLLKDIKADAKERREQGERLLPNKAIQWIKNAKLGAIRLPIELGGNNVSNEELFDVIRQLATADSDVAHALRSHFVFVEDNLIAPPSEERTRRLQYIANGYLVGNATTEISKNPQGSKQYETKLEVNGDNYLLNGQKYFTTGTLYADWVSVIAAGEDDKVFVSVIPTNREGVTVYDDWDGFGQQLTASGTTVFKNVHVEKHEAIELKREKQNYVPVRQLYLQAVIAGIMDEIVEDSVKLLRSRKRTFTHAPTENATEDPLLLQTIGELQASAFTFKTLLQTASKALDQAIIYKDDEVLYQKFQHEAALKTTYVKVIGEQLALQAATKLFDVGGASATRRDNYFDRHWRNIRTIASHNPKSYKVKDIGNYLVNDKKLPVNGYY